MASTCLGKPRFIPTPFRRVDGTAVELRLKCNTLDDGTCMWELRRVLKALLFNRASLRLNKLLHRDLHAWLVLTARFVGDVDSHIWLPTQMNDNDDFVDEDVAFDGGVCGRISTVALLFLLFFLWETRRSQAEKHGAQEPPWVPRFQFHLLRHSPSKIHVFQC